MNISSDVKSLPPLRNPEILIGANDLTTLSYLHEPAGRDQCFDFGIYIYIYNDKDSVLKICSYSIQFCCGIYFKSRFSSSNNVQFQFRALIFET